MRRLQATESGHGGLAATADGAPRERKRVVVSIERLIYLQALFPYASFDQLQNIIADTASADEAASLGYDALNPDYTGVPYLRQQWSLKTDDDASYAERKSAFQGVSETLADRADDIFRLGQLNSVSSVREYDATMHLFPVDTSAWDATFLHGAQSTGEYANATLPFTRGDLSATASKAQSPALRRQSTEVTSAADAGPSANATDFSLGPSGLETASQQSLPAPIVRWAPQAMRVSTHQAREAQQEFFRIFDEATFFRTPLVPSDLSDVPGPQIPLQSQRHDADQSAAKQTGRSLESHEPLELDNDVRSASLTVYANPSTYGDVGDAQLEASASTKIIGPQSRASALIALEELKSHPAPISPRSLQRRMQTLKPLDNTVFQQSDAVGAAGAHVVSPTARNGASRACDLRFDGLPAVGYNGENSVKATSVSVFLEHEVQQWDHTINVLKPYSGVFDFKHRCELVVQLHDHCPLLVHRLDLVLRRLLPVLSAELAGKRLSSGLQETPIELPLCGCKLVSTGEIRLANLDFEEDKCAASFQNEGCRIRLKLKAKTLALTPVPFAYIDEVTATRERRKNAERNAQLDHIRSRGAVPSGSSLNYTKGVTKGSMTVTCKNVGVDLVGGAWLLSSGRVFLIIESAKVKLGSLTVSCDVTKINVLTTLAKPLLKSMLKRQLKQALEGTHQL